jgi:hypothetical protein
VNGTLVIGGVEYATGDVGVSVGGRELGSAQPAYDFLADHVAAPVRVVPLGMTRAEYRVFKKKLDKLRKQARRIGMEVA